MSDPHLGYYAERPQPSLKVVRVLTDEEYERFRDANRLVAGFLHNYQQFEMVRSAFGEYKRLIDHYAQKYRVHPRLNVVLGGEMNHAINRKLRAFFTEIRFFMTLVRSPRPPLEEQYAEAPVRGICSWTEVMLMILPPRLVGRRG